MKNNYKLIFILLYVSINSALIYVLPNEQISDYLDYHLKAVEVARLYEFYPHLHNLYDPFIWPSLYINMMGALYMVFGPSLLIGKIFNVILVLLQFVALEKIVLILSDYNKKIVFFLYLIFFTYPTIYFTNLLTQVENFFVALLLVSFLFFLKITVNKDYRILNFTASAFLLALSILARPVALLIPFFMVIVFINKKIGTKLILYFIVTALLVTGMYGLNTMIKLGKFNAIGTKAGYNLLLAYNPHSTGRYTADTTQYVESLDLKSMNVFEKDSFFMDKALTYILAHPARTILLTLPKLFYLFMYDGKLIEYAFNEENPVERLTLIAVIQKLKGGPTSWVILINQFVYMGLLVMIVVGIFTLIKHKNYETIVLLASLPALILLTTLPAPAVARFHYPIVITSLPLAAYGLFGITGRVFSKRGRKQRKTAPLL